MLSSTSQVLYLSFVQNIRSNQLGPYEHGSTSVSSNQQPQLVLFSQLQLNTNNDKVTQTNAQSLVTGIK